MKNTHYDFADFPRAELPFKVSRRKFFSIFVTNAKSYAEQNHRNGIANLSQLGVMEDEQLSEIVPKILPDCQISIADGFVFAMPPGKEKAVKLFPMDSPALVIFNQFNGRTFLVDVANHMMLQKVWDANYAFAYVRGVFLSLVIAGVCIPNFYTK